MKDLLICFLCLTSTMLSLGLHTLHLRSVYLLRSSYFVFFLKHTRRHIILSLFSFHLFVCQQTTSSSVFPATPYLEHKVRVISYRHYFLCPWPVQYQTSVIHPPNIQIWKLVFSHEVMIYKMLTGKKRKKCQTPFIFLLLSSSFFCL